MTEIWQPSEEVVAATDATKKLWQQGHVFEQGDTVWIADRDRPLTSTTAELSATGLGVTRARDAFLVVVSQTCDIVRACWQPPEAGGGRPFVQVCSVVRLDGDEQTRAAKGWTPRYAHLPGLAPNAFADLDRFATLEKAVLSAANGKGDGCGSDEARLRFAQAVADYFGRFAFPDQMEKAVTVLRRRFRDKHDGQRNEGALMRNVNEIRVRPVSTWDADQIEIELIFLIEPSSLPSLDQCASHPVLDPTLREWADKSPKIEEIVTRLTKTGLPEERNYLWQLLAGEWAKLADRAGRVQVVGAEAISTMEYPILRMCNEPKLSFDHISFDSLNRTASHQRRPVTR
ncbi:MAG: hypothetical protein HKL82_07310 [Acidimicrobiaceae bacterium]|nr:hypothetical protein [Acidimicrobiaceae bacterium]